MKKYNEQEMLNEFSEFVQAEPVAPSKDIDDTVIKMVSKDLKPAPMKVYSKFALIQTFSSLLTLTVCPQFGVGFGRHNEFLHSLHETTPPVVFYLLCGVFFVLLGAVVSGLILNSPELKALGNIKFAWFAIFGVLAYLVLVALGSEGFVASSLAWIVGAFLGSLFGFELTIRLQSQIRTINSR